MTTTGDYPLCYWSPWIRLCVKSLWIIHNRTNSTAIYCNIWAGSFINGAQNFSFMMASSGYTMLRPSIIPCCDWKWLTGCGGMEIRRPFWDKCHKSYISTILGCIQLKILVYFNLYIIIPVMRGWRDGSSQGTALAEDPNAIPSTHV